MRRTTPYRKMPDASKPRIYWAISAQWGMFQKVSRMGMRSSSRLFGHARLLDLFDERRDKLKQIYSRAVFCSPENWRVGIGINGHDGVAFGHAFDVFRRAAYAERQVNLGFDMLA